MHQDGGGGVEGGCGGWGCSDANPAEEDGRVSLEGNLCGSVCPSTPPVWFGVGGGRVWHYIHTHMCTNHMSTGSLHFTEWGGCTVAMLMLLSLSMALVGVESGTGAEEEEEEGCSWHHRWRRRLQRSVVQVSRGGGASGVLIPGTTVKRDRTGVKISRVTSSSSAGRSPVCRWPQDVEERFRSGRISSGLQH